MKKLLFIIASALIVALAVINIFWVIYAFVKYGNKPIAEIPAWAFWYMFHPNK